MDSKKFFSKIGFSYFILITLTLVVQLILKNLIQSLAPDILSRYPILIWIISLAPQYLLAMPVCAALMHRLPSKTLNQSRMRKGQWLSALCIAACFMQVGSILGDLVNKLITALTGAEQTTTIGDMLQIGNIGLIFLLSVIIAPILEELMFRKLLIDRTIVFGDRTAILLSGLMFGMFHGNFNQFFYTFFLGCLFAYVYIRTGKIRSTISLHMLFNFLGGGYLGTFFLKKTDLGYEQLVSGSLNEIMSAFSQNPGAVIGALLSYLLLIILSVIGLILFFVSIRKVKATLRSGEYEMPAGKTFKTVFGNIGMLLFVIMVIAVFVRSYM